MTSIFVSLCHDIYGQLEKILNYMMVLHLLGQYILFQIIQQTFFLQDDDNNFDDTDYDSDAVDSVKTSLTINIEKSDQE